MERLSAGREEKSQVRADWEALAQVLWRGRPAGVWIGLLRKHLVGGVSLDELRVRESLAEGDLEAALTLLWDRGAVVFDPDYLSRRRKHKERVAKLQAPG